MAETPDRRKKTDLRVVKTLDAIRTHFEQLVCECGYDKLTVASLCESARINKKTFYRHYKSLDDLFAQVQREFASEYVELTGHLRIPEDAGEITRRFILYSCETGARSPFYEAVTCTDNCYGACSGTSILDNALWRACGSLGANRPILGAAVPSASRTAPFRGAGAVAL